MSPLLLFKCLSDETRLDIMRLLIEHDSLCVCELHKTLAKPQPKVSQHLSALRRCGLLVGEKRGKWVYYRFNAELPDWVREILELAQQCTQNELPNISPSTSNRCLNDSGKLL